MNIKIFLLRNQPKVFTVCEKYLLCGDNSMDKLCKFNLTKPKRNTKFLLQDHNYD